MHTVPRPPSHRLNLVLAAIVVGVGVGLLVYVKSGPSQVEKTTAARTDEAPELSAPALIEASERNSVAPSATVLAESGPSTAASTAVPAAPMPSEELGMPFEDWVKMVAQVARRTSAEASSATPERTPPLPVTVASSEAPRAPAPPVSAVAAPASAGRNVDEAARRAAREHAASQRYKALASLYGAGPGFTGHGAGASGFTGQGAGSGYTGAGAGSGFTGVGAGEGFTGISGHTMPTAAPSASAPPAAVLVWTPHGLVPAVLPQ